MSLAKRINKVRTEYQRVFGRRPTKYFVSPGRVNLIGEHTDYNDGFVLPAAIDRCIVGACGPRDDGRVSLRSLNFMQAVEFSLDDIKKRDDDPWGNYPKGVASVLTAEGIKLAGLCGVLESDVPVGSGLSSSAALEMMMGLAYLSFARHKVDRRRLAKLCQRAENSFVGVNCGIMDQFIIGCGKKDRALLLDCRSLDYKLVPLRLGGYQLVIGNTRKERTLAGSAYNQRRQSCEAAAAGLGRLLGRRVTALRDVSSREFEKHKRELPAEAGKRAAHVIYENERVLRSIKALRRGGKKGLQEFGQLMIQSHQSLRDLYEVSCFELDTMVELALACPGVIGSRMTGAGFGGCMISLVKKEKVPNFITKVGKEYRRRTGLRPEFYPCRVSDGVKEV